MIRRDHHALQFRRQNLHYPIRAQALLAYWDFQG